MHFEWDLKKAKQNVKKHGISFEEAATIFYDPLSATFYDPDHSEGEDRYITIGYSSQSILLVVSHTERENSIRIISARLASVQERKKHENS
jgi:uncharacterized protein